MAKRLSSEARILNLYDELSEDGKRIVFDLLRSKQPKKAATKKSTKKPARPAGQQSSRRQSVGEQPRSTETPEDAAGGVTGSEEGS